MWEQANPNVEKALYGEAVSPARGKRRGRCAGSAQKKEEKAQGEYLLVVQILLCAAIMAFVLCTQKLGGALYSDVRVLYQTAMQAPGPRLLDEERGFVKFTQQAAVDVYEAACEALADLGGKTAEGKVAASGQPTSGSDTSILTSRAVHAAPAPLYGSSDESYLPPFSLCFPLPDADCSNTSGYGWRIDPVEGAGQEFHTGADLSAAEGTPVLAAADGVVRMARAHDSYGNYVRILHENGDETLYAHMKYLYVRAGQTVRLGQVLGLSGATGNVTGPHLHFELLHEGVRYDPTEALQTAAGE